MKHSFADHIIFRLAGVALVAVGFIVFLLGALAQKLGTIGIILIALPLVILGLLLVMAGVRLIIFGPSDEPEYEGWVGEKYIAIYRNVRKE